MQEVQKIWPLRPSLHYQQTNDPGREHNKRQTLLLERKGGKEDKLHRCPSIGHKQIKRNCEKLAQPEYAPKEASMRPKEKPSATKASPCRWPK
jgi:hypothetical protein